MCVFVALMMGSARAQLSEALDVDVGESLAESSLSGAAAEEVELSDDEKKRRIEEEAEADMERRSRKRREKKMRDSQEWKDEEA